MPRREGQPRREVAEHLAAEERLRRAVLEGRDYEGKAEDLERVKRKQRELGDERLRRAIGGVA